MTTTHLDRAGFERRILALEAFGHRGSATPNEAKAADYLASELRALGLTPTVEPFLGFRSLPGRCSIHVLIAALGIALLPWTVWPCILLGGAACASLLAEHMLHGIWLSRLIPRHPSQNVVAQIPTADRRLRLIVMGHYDTQRTGLIWVIFQFLAPVFWLLPAGSKSPLFPLAVVMFAQVVLGISILCGLDAAYWQPAGRWLLGIELVGLFILGEWALHSYVPGAGDNATGASAVITLAQAWKQQPVPGVELQIVLTGCEESGMTGAYEWAVRHSDENAAIPTLFLNLDNFGFGSPRYLGSAVSTCGWPTPYPPDLLQEAQIVAEQCGLVDAGPHTVPGATDGIAFLQQGLRGLTVISFGAQGRMRNYHRMGDTSANLDFPAAWSAVEYSWKMLHQLAKRSTEHLGRA